ncbi:MAG: TfoX domain protein [Herbinix sp.]|jgi:DNA transformation protein|nr:TfoX domain protein [Herbinix sp.]
MSKLVELPNVGTVLDNLLNQIGVTSYEELAAMGSKQAFIKIRQKDSGACLHMLYGLEGAIEGIKDSLLSKEMKEDLKEFYRALI